MAYITYTLENLNELKSRRGSNTSNTIAIVSGLTNDLLDGTLFYKWDNTSTATNDDKNIVQPINGGTSPGRWIRLNNSNITLNGNTGFGTTNPLHKLVVSNEGNEGLEVAVGVGSERVYLQNVNRNTLSYAPLYYSASSHVFTEGEVTVLPATAPTSTPQLQQVVTLSGTQTISGEKTFSNTNTYLQKLHFYDSEQLGYVRMEIIDGGIRLVDPNFSTTTDLILPLTGNYDYTFPNTSGTLALQSIEENRTGWGQYSGNNYTSGTPLVINAGNTSVLANNGGTSIINSQLPTGVTTFVNTANGKITPENNGDFYIVDIRFKATSSSVDGVIDIGIDVGGALGIIRQHTVSLRKGIGVEQRVAL